MLRGSMTESGGREAAFVDNLMQSHAPHDEPLWWLIKQPHTAARHCMQLFRLPCPSIHLCHCRCRLPIFTCRPVAFQ